MTIGVASPSQPQSFLALSDHRTPPTHTPHHLWCHEWPYPLETGRHRRRRDPNRWPTPPESPAGGLPAGPSRSRRGSSSLSAGPSRSTGELSARRPSRPSSPLFRSAEAPRSPPPAASSTLFLERSDLSPDLSSGLSKPRRPLRPSTRPPFLTPPLSLCFGRMPMTPQAGESTPRNDVLKLRNETPTFSSSHFRLPFRISI